MLVVVVRVVLVILVFVVLLVLVVPVLVGLVVLVFVVVGLAIVSPKMLIVHFAWPALQITCSLDVIASLW